MDTFHLRVTSARPSCAAHGGGQKFFILHVIMREFRCTMSIMFSFFSPHFAVLDVQHVCFHLGNEPFTQALVNTHLLAIRRQGYRCRYPSTATVALQNAYVRNFHTKFSRHTYRSRK